MKEKIKVSLFEKKIKQELTKIRNLFQQDLKLNGAVLYIKPQLYPKLILSSNYDRCVGMEVNLQGAKTLILGIYA